MEDNKDFRKELSIGYLDLLAQYGYADEFARVYAEQSPMLYEAVDNTTKVDTLRELKNIIDFKKGLDREEMHK